jgi:nucleoside-diphosphate-sugar epimerase
MKVMVLGSDGYIGWPLTQALLSEGHDVTCFDDGSRRRRVRELGSNSVTPIMTLEGRINFLKDNFPNNFKGFFNYSLGTDATGFMKWSLREFEPDTIVHLAQQPSAPYSMKNVHTATATQFENTIGTLQLLWEIKENYPGAHLVKIGSMGEYGTPHCNIPEGTIPHKCLNQETYPDIACPMAGLSFPRSPGSFYHLSKVHDTNNLIFACKTWGLRATDIMQGVVFGNIDNTRFDYDEQFGTVINRFCAQAVINYPLTIYGSGGQSRGFLPLEDSIQCLLLAIKQEPAMGEYRVWNQYESVYSVEGLAAIVSSEASRHGIHCTLQNCVNPRVESENHYYNPTCDTLYNLGYIPTTDISKKIGELIETILPYKSRIKEEVIKPSTLWR